MYYIFIQNNKITGKGEAQLLNEGALNIEVSEEIFNNSERYMFKDGQIVLDPDWEEKERIKKQDEIDNLTMTALDFINYLKEYGLTDEMVENYLNNNLAAKHQLMFCQNVYCKVAKNFMPLTIGEVTITDDMIEELFKRKNGVR